MKPKSELILYQTEDNRTRIEVRLENETIWLTQAQMAELFQTTKQNVSLHIRNIFEEGELVEEAVCANYAQTPATAEDELSPDSVVRKFRITAADGKTYDSVVKGSLTTAPPNKSNRRN
jgi:hypothetical protein